MAGIEQLLHDSLVARARDVEPTPRLWEEIDARIVRRRRWRATGFAVAGAGVAAAAVLLGPGLFATSTPQVPEIMPADPAPGEDPADDDGERDAREDDAPDGQEAQQTDDPRSRPDVDDVALLDEPLPEPVALLERDRLLLLDGSAEPSEVAGLPAGEVSRFAELAARPGSDPGELTVVARTTADSSSQLWWLRVVDGEVVGDWEAFDPAHAAGVTASGDPWVSGPVWSPDGESIAYATSVGGEVTLHTVGWDDGPGTGDPATDNAAFALAELSGAVRPRLDAWVDTGDGSSEVWLHSELAAGYLAVPFERQADGSLARPGGGAAQLRSLAVDEPVLALAPGRVTPTDRIRWSVHHEADGPVVVDDAEREPIVSALPVLTLDDEPHTRPWIASVGSGVAVGSSEGPAWFRGEPTLIVRLPGEPIDLEVLR